MSAQLGDSPPPHPLRLRMASLFLLPSLQESPYLGSPWRPWQLVWPWQERHGQGQSPLAWL